jgi:Na+-driven multidrug efflux pump
MDWPPPLNLHLTPVSLDLMAEVGENSVVTVSYGKSEFSKWFSLAWPVSLASLARMGMYISDLAILGHLQHDAAFPKATSDYFLGAAGLSFTWMAFTSSMISMGFGAALSTLSAQALGAKNPRLVGIWFQCCLVVVLFACIPIGIAWWYTDAAVLLFVGGWLSSFYGLGA